MCPMILPAEARSGCRSSVPKDRLAHQNTSMTGLRDEKKEEVAGTPKPLHEKLAQFWNISASQRGDLRSGGHAIGPARGIF